MKKVTLLGDSIRLGYEKRVIELLGDEYEVFRYDSNGRFAQNTMRSLYDFRKEIAGSDVIHWNNGHWDICDVFGDGPFTPEEHYVYYLKRIAKLLLAITPNVIFAATTPVKPQNKYETNELIERYNKLAAEALIPMGVKINDLYTAVGADVDRYICDDFIHLTPDGVELCAGLAVDAIKSTV